MRGCGRAIHPGGLRRQGAVRNHLDRNGLPDLALSRRPPWRCSTSWRTTARRPVAGEVRAKSQAVHLEEVLADPLGLIPICVPALCTRRTLPQIETPPHV